MSRPTLRRFYFSLFVLLLSTLPGTLVAAPAQGLPSFSGNVEDMNGQPIAGVKIDISWNERQNDPELDSSVPPGDNLLGSATSDADGAFQIEWSNNIPVLFEKQDFRLHMVAFHNEFIPIQKPLTLDDSGAIVMTIKLRNGMRYADRVVDKSGAPIQGAVVRLEGLYRKVKSTVRVSYSDESYIFFDQSNTPTTRTDEDGVFEFASIPPNAIILLRVQHPDFAIAMRLRSTFPARPPLPDLSNRGAGFKLWWNDFNDAIELERGKTQDVIVRDRATKKTLANVEICTYFQGGSNTSDQNGRVMVRDDMKSTVVLARVSKDDRWEQFEIFKQDAGHEMWIESPNAVQISGSVRDKQTGVGLPNVPIASRFRVLGATGDSGRFTISVANARSINLSCKGPVDGWMVPFQRKTTNPNEIELVAQDKNEEIRFDPRNPEKELLFEFERIPTLQFQVIGLNGKPAEKAKLTISPMQIHNVHTKDRITDSNGMVALPILRNIGYSLLAQGHDDGAAVATFRSAANDETRKIQLVPSIQLELKVSNVGRDFNEGPAVGASVMISLDRNQSGTFGLQGDIPFAIRLGQVDEEGFVRCKFPTSDLSLRNWNVYAGGKFYSQSIELDFRSDSNLEIALRRIESSDFGLSNPRR